MNKLNIFSALALMLLSLVIGSVAAFAVSPDYDVTDVKVNNVDLAGATFDVERGEVLNIEILINGINNVDDVRVKAEIDGYEHGDIEDRTSLFDVEAGKLYKKTLNLVIPNDIDASETYTLRVEVSDDDNQEEFNVNLHIDEQRHNLGIFDVLVNPSGKVEAGRPLFITARIENLGSMKEEDVKVTASISELGVSTSGYIDELITEKQEDIGTSDDDEENSQSIDLTLRIPDDAASGNYNVKIDVEFNRGNDVVSTTETISINGVDREESEAVVSIDSTSKDVRANEETAYRLMIANIGDERAVYSVSVDGSDLWANSRVEPSFVTVDPDSTADVKVLLAAKDEASAGSHSFVVRVNEGKTVAREISLNANVVESSVWGGLRQVLTVIFVLLVVLLVVLGIIIAFKKMSSEGFDEETTEPTITEGQTYYYYPRN